MPGQHIEVMRMPQMDEQIHEFLQWNPVAPRQHRPHGWGDGGEGKDKDGE